MALTILENKTIKSNQKQLNNFLDDFHQYKKIFTIDCEELNIDNYFNSETRVTIRHTKPNNQSIYYTEIYKEKDENVYLFGLARENVIATSSYFNEGAKIKPILVATLNTEDSSKSNLVFANNSEDYSTVLLLRIDCSNLSDLELRVLIDKNKITNLNDGIGFINLGSIEHFDIIRNIRNFISNVEFIYDNSLNLKISHVSIPEEYKNTSYSPNDDVIKDRFFNGGVEVYDLNVYENEDESLNDSDNEKIYVNEDAAFNDLDNEKVYVNEDVGLIDLNNNPISPNEEKIHLKDYSIEDSADEVINNKNEFLDSYELIEDNNLLNNSIQEINKTNSEESCKLFNIENNDIIFDMSIYHDDYFDLMYFFNNLKSLYTINLEFIEILDMGDGLLEISLIISIENYNELGIIKELLIKNDFVEN